MAKVCRRSGKTNYPSENAARKALARVRREATMQRRFSKVEIAYYSCRFCPYWHLTSQEQREADGAERTVKEARRA